jgi:hypothetical protein
MYTEGIEDTRSVHGAGTEYQETLESGTKCRLHRKLEEPRSWEDLTNGDDGRPT